MNHIPNEQLYKSDNIVFDDQKVWTKLSWFNDLLEIDRVSGNAKAIPLPNEFDGMLLSHRCINKCGKKIYIIPFKARTLLIYDIEKECFTSMQIPDNAFKETEKFGYTQSAIIGDFLVMFGYHLSVLVYNIRLGEFTVVDAVKNMYSEEESLKLGFWSWVADGYILYIHIVSKKTVVELNVLTGVAESYSVNSYDYIDGVLEYKNGIFLSVFFPKDGNTQFVWWNKDGVVVDSCMVPSKAEGGVRSFSWMALFEDCIYCIPGSYPKALKVDAITREVNIFQDIPSVGYEYMHERKTEPELNYCSYIQMQNCDYSDGDGLMITIQMWLGCLVTVDAKKNCVRTKHIELDAFSRKRLLYEQLKRKGINLNSYTFANEDCVMAGLEGYVAFLAN